MSPELPKPARVLLFGQDAGLLETRAKVLESVGITAEIALHVRDFTNAGSLYDGVVCCYDATEAECKEMVDISNRNRTPLLKLEPFLSPPELIRQVISLVRDGYPGLEGATDSPS